MAGPLGGISIITLFTPFTAVSSGVELAVLEVSKMQHNMNSALFPVWPTNPATFKGTV